MNEALIRRLWLAGPWPRGLPQTTDGRSLQIVFTGRPGTGAGPDLRDAIVALPDGRLVEGDVELHVRASDWASHGHQNDPRYSKVALHLVWRDDLGRPVERRAEPGAPPILTVALVEQPTAALFERIGCPARRDDGYHEWLERLPIGEVGALLEQLGDERIAAKAVRIAADLHALGPDEALHRAVSDVLGYTQNRAAFARLADLAPAGELRALALSCPDPRLAERAVLAHLLETAGLCPPPSAGAIVDIGGGSRASPAGSRMSAGEWQIVGVRPANRPQRRIAALARIAARHRTDRLADVVVRLLGDLEPRAALAALLAAVRSGAEEPTARASLGVVTGAPWGDPSYWADHVAIDRPMAGPSRALLGEDRARAMLVNALLPFALAVADQRGDRALEARALSAWRQAPPSGANWIIREMRPLLRGLPFGSARREQGAIELYRRCCQERRCRACPTASYSAGRTTARA